MKNVFFAAALVAGAVIVGGPLAAEFSRVKSEEQFRTNLVGKKYHDKYGNWFRWNADGTMSGKLKSKKKFSGAWVWSKKFVCRNVRIAGEELGTDCQIIEVDGNSVRFTRKKGKGDSGVLTMK
jgi:hypothetical protein